MKLFDRYNDCPIVLEKGADEAILLAVRDLQQNLRRLAGKPLGFALAQADCDRAIEIRTVPAEEPEAYTVNVGEHRVTITGTDTLGTVYGIYAFAKSCLGILPIYRLTDLFPEEREELLLEKTSFRSQKRTVRFRGWFLNDEDLLTDWKISGGVRHIDYPFYKNVMDVSVLDMILETALRMEINLVIPSSFIDIRNPAEEALVGAVCRRGLYVSQHHVEPVGVSYFAADNYMQANGYKDEKVSFLSNRDRMEEIWRYYIGKWAKYGDRVIWQLGLRGKADQAVWRADPNVPADEAARGAIITDAINTQHALIREALGKDDFHSTVTLWMEGAALYGKGHIRVPRGAIIIFCDIGLSQMFSSDFYVTERKKTDRYGIYYHVGYWSQGPHLAEGTDPFKMAFCYREASQKDSLYYAILNVSNVRPLHFSTWLSTRLLQDPANAQADGAIQKQLDEIFGADAERIAPLLTAYYATIADRGTENLKYLCRRYEFDHYDHGSLPFVENPMTDGVLSNAIKRMAMGQKEHFTNNPTAFRTVLAESLPRWEALCQRAEGIAVSERRALYFEQFLKFEIFYMMQMTKAALACYDLTTAKDLTALENARDIAVTALDSVLEKRKILERDGWEGWHRGEVKIDVRSRRRQIEELYQRRKEEWK